VTKNIALFDIIISNIRADLWTIYSNQLNNLQWVWRDSLLANRNSLEANYLADQHKFDDDLKSMDAWFGLITLD
jgi:hypothetical protein